MTKHQLKEALIEYIKVQDMVDGEYNPGWYYLTAEVKIEDDGTVLIRDPSFTLLVAKK